MFDVRCSMFDVSQRIVHRLIHPALPRLTRPALRPYVAGGMTNHTLAEIVPYLQIAIGPVILISGVGLLLLSMTNRFGRVIDRSRILARESASTPSDKQAALHEQVAILYRRARLLRLSIGLALGAALLAGLLIISLFAGALMTVNVVLAVELLFVGSMALLIASLVVLLLDINLSLHAVTLELKSHKLLE
jgi:hypothetical protein